MLVDLKTFKHFRILSLILFLSVTIRPDFSRAAPIDCALFLTKHMTSEQMIEKTFRPDVARAWAKYNEMPDAYKVDMDRAEVLSILSNHEMPLFQERMIQVIFAVSDTISRNEAYSKDTILNFLRSIKLHEIESALGFQSRLNDAISSEKINWIRALGDRTVDEVQTLVYGTNPLDPAPNSMIRLYEQRLGAQGIQRNFPLGPGKQGNGPAKMVLQLPQNDLNHFKSLFNLPEFFFHFHTPSQGTMNIMHRGKVGTYATATHEMTAPQVDTMLPMILLSTREANRLYNYLQLGEVKTGIAQLPWTLENYCARGGYDSCTHWFGNIPIGEALVPAYTFPGNVDRYASGASSRDPQTRDLADYRLNKDPLSFFQISTVWQAPGHEQLADVLGVREANVSGELANPGWVFHTLAALVSATRVPVVFYVPATRQENLSPEFPIRVQAY